MKKNTLIEVEWDDTVFAAIWYTEKNASIKQPVMCRTVGYFLNKDKKVLRLSHTIQVSQYHERDISVIPIGCITKIRRLSEK